MLCETAEKYLKSNYSFINFLLLFDVFIFLLTLLEQTALRSALSILDQA